jgi:hypothetical protein
MALRHRRFPVVGLQFHPESILTDAGYGLLAAFVELAGLQVVRPLPTIQQEYRVPPCVAKPLELHSTSRDFP